PATLQLVAGEREIQLARGQRPERVAVAGPVAVVEHVDVAGAVVALRDVALERSVFKRMILDLHRQPLLAGAQRWPLRHRPTLERAVDLEPEIVVARARVVQLHHEDRPTPGHPARVGGWLRRAVEATLARVVAQAHRPSPPCASSRPSSWIWRPSLRAPSSSRPSSRPTSSPRPSSPACACCWRSTFPLSELTGA